MNFTSSLLFFGFPGLAIFVGLYLGVPLMASMGVPLIISWTLALWLPVVVLLGLVLNRFRTNPSGQTFRTYFKLTRLTRSDWIAILIAFIVVQILEISLSRTGAFFAQYAFFAPPSVIPALFDPTFRIETGLTHFFGVPVQGNWWLVLFWLGWLVVNIGGEELLWRGYALPRQERVFGKYAWLVNGLCWNLLIHAFMRWNFITLMPISLIIPYLVQTRKNTLIGIWLHGLGNLLVLAILIPSIMA